MSLIEEALKSFNEKFIPQPISPPNYDQSYNLLLNTYKELRTPNGKSKLQWLVTTKGGSSWIFNISEDAQIYREVEFFHDKLQMQLDDIPELKGCLLYLENGFHPDRVLLSYPVQRIKVTFVKVSYSK